MITRDKIWYNVTGSSWSDINSKINPKERSKVIVALDKIWFKTRIAFFEHITDQLMADNGEKEKEARFY